MDDIEWIDVDLDSIGDEHVYSEHGREKLLDDEEISLTEEAFMEGYDKAFE